MLHPILKMRFTAMLWYQGESNLDGFQGTWAGPRVYACRARAAVADWRAKFEAPNLPVFYVELAACDNYDNAQQSFPLLRQAQRTVLSLPGITGFITAIDVGIGGGVHSPIKVPDGQRLALQLLQKVYNVTGIKGADGPTLSGVPDASPSTIRLSFTGATALHTSAVNDPGTGCSTSPFEIGLSDGTWQPASFTINSTTVSLAIRAEEAAVTVTEVRYAWLGYPQCALYSGIAGNWNSTMEGVVPAAPFRVAVAAGCAPTQTRCPVMDGTQCCMNSDVKPDLPGGEICTAHGGGCQCKGCVGSNTPFQ